MLIIIAGKSLTVAPSLRLFGQFSCVCVCVVKLWWRFACKNYLETIHIHTPDDFSLNNYYFLRSNTAAAATELRRISPMIIPMASDFTALKNTNVTFMCYSDEMITWHVPWHLDVGNFEMQHEIIGNIYKAKLSLFNVSHKYVGFYECIKFTAKVHAVYHKTLFHNLLASRIYLFVEGT